MFSVLEPVTFKMNILFCSTFSESKADGVETPCAAPPCVGGEAETVSEQLSDVAGETKTTNFSDTKEEEMKTGQEVSISYVWHITKCRDNCELLVLYFSFSFMLL